tara:strand:+ start:2749 stop:2898 length:150 start_codon:yes stop_codon:yes gene_type:complete
MTTFAGSGFATALRVLAFGVAGFRVRVLRAGFAAVDLEAVEVGMQKKCI